MKVARWIPLKSLLFVTAALQLPTTLSAQSLPTNLPAPKYSVRLEKSVLVPMRDGVKLSADLYFPEGAAKKLPVILFRTPYNKQRWRSTNLLFAPTWFFAGQGYIVLVQDVRGKFESQGEYVFAGGDAKDGYDTTEWAAKQPWSTGKVGAYGCSYLGEVQYQQAVLRNPNLTALIPQGAGPMQYRAGGGITGGVLELATMVGWVRSYGSKYYYRPPAGTSTERFRANADNYNPDYLLPEVDYRKIWESLPVIDMLRKAGAPPTDWDDLVSRDFSDPWWNKTDFIKTTDRFDVPALHVNSWYDFGIGETLKLFNQMRTNADSARGRENQYAIVSPTTHCLSETLSEHTFVGARNLGDARFDHFGTYLRWFDHWLRGADNGVTKMPKLQIYVMGRNHWRAENEWPLARARFTNYYLHSDGHANSRFGTGALTDRAAGGETSDSYTYDPAVPAPTTGGAICVACAKSSEIVDGALDQSQVESRHDVLVYTSPMFAEGIEVTGPIELVLYVSSSAKDTDFVAKLVDVYPDGTAYNLQEGILRARYREGFEKKVWMKPGEVVELRINLNATSNFFAPKHRIRLEVSSSSFPRFERNLNTGGNNYDETTWVVAENVVHHSTQYPSHLVLPVVPN
jgi:putative CocE/NonD family hydrolase